MFYYTEKQLGIKAGKLNWEYFLHFHVHKISWFLFTASFFVQKIHLENAEKENNVHQNDDSQS